MQDLLLQNFLKCQETLDNWWQKKYMCIHTHNINMMCIYIHLYNTYHIYTHMKEEFLKHDLNSHQWMPIQYTYDLGQGIKGKKLTKEGRHAQTEDESIPWAKEDEPLIWCPDEERNTIELDSTSRLDLPCWLCWPMLISIQDNAAINPGDIKTEFALIRNECPTTLLPKTLPSPLPSHLHPLVLLSFVNKFIWVINKK